MYIFLLLLAPVSECYGDPFLVAQRAVGRRSPHSPSFLAAAATTRSQAQHSTTTTSAATAFAAGSAMSRHGAPLLTAAAGDAGSPKSKLASAIVRYRSLLLLLCLVLHKCSTDGLTRWTRLQGAYSGKTVAVMSEVLKFPLIALAITTLGGGRREIIPKFVAAATTKPFSNAWIALCYTFNNLLYFDALSVLSAVAYQVLSQSKTLFTAGLMYVIVGKRLLGRQIVAILMLIAGALLVQVEEMAKASAGPVAAAAAASSSAIWWGVGATLFSSFISALPNVAYEKVLKTEGEDQWVNNVQVTVWIMIWISLATYVMPVCRVLLDVVRAVLGGSAAPPSPMPSLSVSAALAAVAHLPETLAQTPAALRAAFEGFTLPVWGVVVLKALNGILIPATFKYADNLLYAYAKPSSIVLTTVLTCLFAGVLPAPSLVLGVALVVGSIMLYSSKPKPKIG